MVHVSWAQGRHLQWLALLPRRPALSKRPGERQVLEEEARELRREGALEILKTMQKPLKTMVVMRFSWFSSGFS